MRQNWRWEPGLPPCGPFATAVVVRWSLLSPQPDSGPSSPGEGAPLQPDVRAVALAQKLLVEDKFFETQHRWLDLFAQADFEKFKLEFSALPDARQQQAEATFHAALYETYDVRMRAMNASVAQQVAGKIGPVALQDLDALFHTETGQKLMRPSDAEDKQAIGRLALAHPEFFQLKAVEIGVLVAREKAVKDSSFTQAFHDRLCARLAHAGLSYTGCAGPQ